MRISDWSSDVCSSDLQNDGEQDLLGGEQIHDPAQLRQGVVGGDVRLYVVVEVEVPTIEVGCRHVVVAEDLRDVKDRKSVVTGKSVSVSVDLGGLRSNKKTNKKIQHKNGT